MRSFTYLFLLTLLSIQAYSQNPWTPYTTSTKLRNGAVGTPDAVILTDKAGAVFLYNPANTTSADDSVSIIRQGNRRYERVSGNTVSARLGASLNTPHATSTELRAGAVGTPDAVILTDKLGYIFLYNPSNTTVADDSAMVIRYGNRRYERVFSFVSPEMYGAVGDNIVDDTRAINRCIKKASLSGVRVEFHSSKYKVTDTLIIGYGVAKTHISGNGATVYFHNNTSDKPLFSLTPASSHSLIENLHIIDQTPGTSTGIRIAASNPAQSIGPNWKNLFRNLRVSSFKTGTHITVAGSTTNPAEAGWASENLFLHSKYRNCRVAFLLDNVQSVNNSLISTDIENDDPNEQYEMIRFNAGGGMSVQNSSLIGKGRVFTWKGGTGLFSASNISFSDCRIEARPTHVGQLIYQEPSASYYAASRLFIAMDNMSIEPFGQSIDLIHFSGRAYLSGSGISCSSGKLAVRQFPVAGISGALGVGSLGSVQISNSVGIKIIEDNSDLYGSYDKRFSIPVRVDGQQSDTNGSNGTDANGFIYATNPPAASLGYGLVSIQPYRLVFNDPQDQAGFQSIKMILPKYATPAKLIMFKQPVRFSVNIRYKLYIVKDVQYWVNQNSFNPSTDAYLVANTGDTIGKSGFFEVPIQMLVNTIGYRMQAGISDNWQQGRMYLENSGGAFAGFVGVEYY